MYQPQSLSVLTQAKAKSPGDLGSLSGDIKANRGHPYDPSVRLIMLSSSKICDNNMKGTKSPTLGNTVSK